MGCIKFNGTNSKFIVPLSNVPTGNNPRTIQLSFKTDNGNTSGTLLSYGSTSSGRPLILFIIQQDGTLYFESGSASNKLVTTKSYNDNEWHKLTQVFDGSNLITYIDTEKVQDIQNISLQTAFSDLYFGYYFGDGGRFFRGYMDEIRIWDRALTENEIFKTYDKKLRGTEKGLILYYPFDSKSTDLIGDKTNKIQGNGINLEYIKDDGIQFTTFMILKDNKYYSINNEYYNTDTQMYNEIPDFSKDKFNDYSFDPSVLFSSVTIEDETFRPIDKFGTGYKLISLDNVKSTAMSIKTTKQLFISNGDISTRLASNIDYFSLLYDLHDENCIIKIVLSTDSGKTWKTCVDGSWVVLENTVVSKDYSKLTKAQKQKWDLLLDEILEKGINVQDVEKIDFNTIDMEKIRFAYAIQIQDVNSVAIIKNLKWQFDSIGSYTQLNPKTDVDISMTNNAISIKPLKDIELMKINVGISSNVIESSGSSLTPEQEALINTIEDKADKDHTHEVSDIPGLENHLTIDSLIAGDNIQITKNTDSNTVTIKANNINISGEETLSTFGNPNKR